MASKAHKVVDIYGKIALSLLILTSVTTVFRVYGVYSSFKSEYSMKLILYGFSIRV